VGSNLEKAKTGSALLLICLLMPFHVFAERICQYEELAKPRNLTVRDGRVYVPDQNSLFVYDLKTNQLLARLGKQGQGPRELSTTPFVAVTDARIYLFDGEKALVYANDFRYLKEFALKGFPSHGTALSEGMVISEDRGGENQGKHRYSLRREDGKMVFLTEVTFPIMRDYLISPYPIVKCWKDKVFVYRPAEQLIIEIYGQSGKLESAIRRKLDEVKSTELHRRKAIDKFIEVLGKMRYDRLNRRNRIELKSIPSTLPDLEDFSVVDGKLYLKTYDITPTKDKYLVLDLKGNLLATHWLPRVLYRSYSFWQNRFYYLVDAEDGFELHCKELNSPGKIGLAR